MTDPDTAAAANGIKYAWTIAALVLALLPFANDLPLWPFVLALATCLWRWVAHVKHWALPRTPLRLAWTFANVVYIVAVFGTINGLEAGTALLVVMVAMKLTESRSPRDLVVLLFMAYFLVVAHFLFDQGIHSAALALPSLWLTTTALTQVSRRTAPRSSWPAMRGAAGLLAQAVPLLLVLFLLFPRVPGPFWSLPSRAAGTTGLSDSMEPGTISQLLRSSAVAFRVQFQGTPPPARELYWRGPVLTKVRGRRWTPVATRPVPPPIRVRDDAVWYEITLEPHEQRWLFALDAPDPDATPAWARVHSDLQVQSTRRVRQRLRYELTSFTDYRVETELPSLARAINVDTRNTSNPRTLALAAGWRANSDNNLQIVTQALQMFREEQFSYTLNPPVLSTRSSVDEFLFESRRGFCEHYASAFTLLMRYAGIPTRVVTGYQGGEKNAISGHYTVRQSDAHAWAEVWLENRGWVRVDPTAAVAPERIESGISYALGAGEGLPALMLSDSALVWRLRHAWDAANAGWNTWVLGYGQRTQLDFLARLGLHKPNLTKLVALLSVGVIAVLLGLSAWLAWQGRPREHDRYAEIYRRFCVKLARLGVTRAASEGPQAFATRAAHQLPEHAPGIDAIATIYIRERYGPAPSATALTDLSRRVRRFPKAA